MSLESDGSLDWDAKGGGLIRGRYRYFPVVPGRVEFAIALRRLLLEKMPTLVAVELPEFLAPQYRRALQRLPEMSVILYRPQDEDEEVRTKCMACLSAIFTPIYNFFIPKSAHQPLPDC